VEFQSTIVMPMPPKGGVNDAAAKPAETAPPAGISTKEPVPAPATRFQEADTQEQIEGIDAPVDADKVVTAEHPAIEDVPVPKVLTEFETPETFAAPPVEEKAPIEAKAEETPFEPLWTEPAPVEMQPAATAEPTPTIHEEPVESHAAEPVHEPEPEPQVAEAEIAPPAEKLDLPDSFSAPSMFDSVRIMENHAPEIKADEPQPQSAVIKPEATAEPAPPPKSREPRQHTAPNIGLVDTDGRKAAKLKPLDEGTVLNSRYEIVRKIGGGGMGAVYLASDNNLGGVLRAVKEMVQSYIEESQQDKAINDFKRESMILSTLDHPSIPTIFDYFFDEKESRFYLVMKYISGGDLSARLRAAPEGRVDEKSVTEWAIQIADVLDYLHNQPSTIVYRDLKPSNIMIDGNTNRVMLIDFGIARAIGQIEEKGVTAVGTMGYAPPELFSGNVEPRSDIYSLGSTMFHLLTGADPQSNPLLIFDFQKNPRPRQINPQLSDQIEQILMRSVEYSAGSRFSTAAEMKQALDEHLSNLKSGRVTYGVKAAPSSVSLANQSVFCGFCGQKIVATDLFCAFCGSKQPMAQHGVHSEIYTPARMTAKLLVTGTSEFESSTFDLEKSDNLIGRRDPMSNIFPEVDLSRYDPQTKISRRHARIWREGNDYLVEDLGSSNGTTLLAAANKSMRLLPHQPAPLTNGDQLRVGDTTLHFVIG
ncbi:MAG TPA: protein kinase, partial [Pyrinomonadaceae bacterium]|nr:protein kinase [Pyrinomonadaceae bacterium]